jgi:flagellar biosynthesis/type III secretory pathway protein FliH
MSAAPIARYLLELDVGDDARATPPGWSGTGKPPTMNKLAMVDEAYAKGFDSGKATAESQIESKIAERDTLHQQMLASAREAWTRLEAERLTEQLVKGLEALEARLADTTARILKPFLAAEMHRKAITDLAETLTVLRRHEKTAEISVSGTADLLEALRAQLEGKFENVSYHRSDACDVRITVGQTVLETRVGAWLSRIEEAMK